MGGLQGTAADSGSGLKLFSVVRPYSVHYLFLVLYLSNLVLVDMERAHPSEYCAMPLSLGLSPVSSAERAKTLSTVFAARLARMPPVVGSLHVGPSK